MKLQANNDFDDNQVACVDGSKLDCGKSKMKENDGKWEQKQIDLLNAFVLLLLLNYIFRKIEFSDPFRKHIVMCQKCHAEQTPSEKKEFDRRIGRKVSAESLLICRTAANSTSASIAVANQQCPTANATPSEILSPNKNYGVRIATRTLVMVGWWMIWIPFNLSKKNGQIQYVFIDVQKAKREGIPPPGICFCFRPLWVTVMSLMITAGCWLLFDLELNEHDAEHMGIF